ncbi:MAG: single-stranded-DNA-specific exonuclease RecJ [Treponemataceae bacterium]|nr:single-stranded-DNA-specific exonuclease RecJ [Treponemataceae bacterium]
MNTWNKKPVPRELTKELTETYGIDALTAAILIRRGVMAGEDIQYFLEDDKRFLHSPFAFTNMEDAVDRILQARDEGEKVLIFGDRDVDGVTGTTVLYECFTSLGIDTRWRLPGGNDAYGLNKAAVDEFAADYGTLIVTIDCGISNGEEIAYAASLGIDVIVLDHHNPPETLPSPAIIMDAKCAGAGYPFADISGCAVAFKTTSALRFAQSELYKQEICLLSVRPVNEAYTISCMKVQNLVQKAVLEETVIPGSVPVGKTRLPDFLRGQQIFVWDGEQTRNMLTAVFGTGVEFNLMDIRPEIAKRIPAVAGLSLVRLKSHSKIARYNPAKATEIEGFYNIFVTYMHKQLAAQFPRHEQAEERELQLVALAAIADVMPLKNENRIFLRHGLAAINAGRVRPGLLELLSHRDLLGKRITSTTLAWQVVPVLNAAGRLGQPELAAELFMEETPTKRDALAAKIVELNNQRKRLDAESFVYAKESAETSIAKHADKLCVVIDERIHRGVSGLVAGKLCGCYNIPAIVATVVDDTVIGSMRSCRSCDATKFLNKMDGIFLNHGGHNSAAGFSLKKDRMDEFMQTLELLAPTIELTEDTSGIVNVDAELPPSYLKPDVLNVVDAFEPYGEKNQPLTFMSQSLRIIDAQITGKGERTHLKLTLDCGEHKWPAMFWGESGRLHRDFDKGDSVDILYEIKRNLFNGMETPQIILKDIRRREAN